MAAMTCETSALCTILPHIATEFITTLSSTLHNETIALPDLNSHKLANFCGAFHENINFLEHFFHITIKIGPDQLTLYGHEGSRFNRAKQVIQHLFSLSHKPISLELLHTLVHEQDKDSPSTMNYHSIKLNRKIIAPRNNKQADYLSSIDKQDLIFAVGPAGTGKTYLAVAKAIESFEKGEVQRLVFVRPAVEAGEKLGFLPGDLVEKILPYLRPIYDALYEMIGFKEAQKLIQSDVIEVLPLAFMRGRTLNEAFIILDEAQNTTIMQMKMFLTRMGFGSKAVVTGDITQVDLPKGIDSGLSHAVRLLANMPETSIHRFTSQEVVRHPLVSKIVDYYEKLPKDKE